MSLPAAAIAPSKSSEVDRGFSPWLKTIAYPLGRLSIPLYFRQIEIIGSENIPRSGATILAPTHRSRWDSLVLPYCVGHYVTGRDLRFMVSSDEMTGLQGFIVRRLGGFPVDTEKLAPSTFRQAIDILADGQMLTIFPEGNIFRTPELQEIKPGLARIALQAHSLYGDIDVKIVPVAIQYDRDYPTWGSRVRVNIGKAIPVNNYDHRQPKASGKQLTADLTAALSCLIARHSN
jgi:1-acyl-sn-glycerol-3-phosphate acyltransferase